MTVTRTGGQEDRGGCSDCDGYARELGGEQPSAESKVPKLEDLIPIAVVIAGGCEKCAQRMVVRALNNGASPRHIRKVMAIVALFQKQDCFAEEVGAEVIARMRRPLAMGRRTLEMLTAVRE